MHGEPNGGAGVEPADPAEDVMLSWTLVFLGVALVAGLFGFGGIASVSAGMVKVLFTVFVVLFVASLIFGVIRGA
jgi:uncharacterized membrane protein YtjA (UPF0391 family)